GELPVRRRQACRGRQQRLRDDAPAGRAEDRARGRRSGGLRGAWRVRGRQRPDRRRPAGHRRPGLGAHRRRVDVGGAWQAVSVPPATKRRTATTPSGRSWDEPTLAPVVLVRGAELLLTERAVDGVVRLARERDPEVEKVELEGATYGAGQLAVAASPSLFGEAKVVVV